MKWILAVSIALGGVFGQQKKIIVKKKTAENDKERTVDVVTDGNEMTVVVDQDGKTEKYTINLYDKKALGALKKNLSDIDVDLHTMIMESDNIYTIHKGGYLGVQIQDMTDQLRKYFKVKGDGGVLISEVVEESPAEKAGLKAGDVLIKVNDSKVKDTDDLQREIRNKKPESTVKLTLIRKGRKKTLEATLEKSDSSFSWTGKMPGMKNHKMHQKIMKKYGKNHDMEFFLKDEGDMTKHFNMRRLNSTMDSEIKKELKQLKKELNSLKKEIKKLQKS